MEPNNRSILGRVGSGILAAIVFVLEAIWLTVVGIYKAVNFLWTTLLILLIGAAIYIVFFAEISPMGDIETAERVFNQDVSAVPFDFEALDYAESTAALGLTGVERMDRMRRATVIVRNENGTGSGVLIDNKQCLVVTNHHVLAAMPGEFWVEAITRFRANGEIVSRKIDAEIVGLPSVDDDLGIIKLSECDGLPFAILDDSFSLNAGQDVIAIGNPHFNRWTVTRGIVSNPTQFMPFDPFFGDISATSGFPVVQTDAAINGGNSGGPLYTLEGGLVGINSMKDPRADNIGYARSSNLVMAYIGRLEASGRADVRRLGIVATENDDGSAVVADVVPTTVAARYNIRPGDVVLAVNNTQVDGVRSITRAIYADADGVVTMIVMRDGQAYRLNIDFNASTTESATS